MKRLAPALAIVVLLTICASCLVATLVTHGSLANARTHCTALPIGTARADAERTLGAELGASLLGWAGGGPAALASEISVGRRGSLVSWECVLSLDASGAVARTRFTWWVVPDFHGGWDDRARDWLEANFL